MRHVSSAERRTRRESTAHSLHAARLRAVLPAMIAGCTWRQILRAPRRQLYVRDPQPASRRGDRPDTAGFSPRSAGTVAWCSPRTRLPPRTAFYRCTLLMSDRMHVCGSSSTNVIS